VSAESGEPRARVIEAIKTPLGLLALVILAIEAVLAMLATKAQGNDLTILLVGLIGTMVLVVVGIYLVAWRRPDLLSGGPQPVPDAALTPVSFKYDAFISAPMASFNGDEKAYQRSRHDILKLVKELEDGLPRRKVFYAGASLPSLKDFEVADLSLATDLAALRESRCCILIYPQEIATSALVEVGFAIGLKKPVVIHLLDGVSLPFLLRYQQGASETHGEIHIYDYANFHDILQVYRVNPDLLERLAAPTH
jgi:hypothetical protein